MTRLPLLALALSILPTGLIAQDETLGYYRSPAIHGDTIVFVAEGDLWRVSTAGGTAYRITTHPAEEFHPAISPDGEMLAFTASYEGPKEIYTMPLTGGRPTRWTYAADGGCAVAGFLPNGRVLVSTSRYADLPNRQLIAIDIGNGAIERLPLAQADQGSVDPATNTLFFTRQPFQGSHAKRYRGGYIQNLWSFSLNGDAEARWLTAGFDGISKQPMYWQGRLYHLTDRDGSMNLWSMRGDGSDLRRHTGHVEWDILSADQQGGRIVYRIGADLHLFDIETNTSTKLKISLASDHDHTRTNWIEDPFDDLTSVHLSADGSQLALTSRGKAFTAPADGGRVAQIPQVFASRYRNARFAANDDGVLVFSDESAEAEIWLHSKDGKKTQLTTDGDILRTQMLPSPDGKWIAHVDKNAKLHLLEIATKTQHQLGTDGERGISDLHWSSDSQWLAHTITGTNQLARIRIVGIEDKTPREVTSDRWTSRSPAFSADGKWLFFLSDRNFRSLVGGPWGTYQPEPFFDHKTKIYALALQKGLRSPFLPHDELHPKTAKDKKATEDEKTNEGVVAAIDFDGIGSRIWDVPVAPGNYRGLVASTQRLLWNAGPELNDRGTKIQALTIEPEPEVETVADDLWLRELSGDGKKILATGGGFGTSAAYVFATGTKNLKGEGLKKARVGLSSWTFAVQPLEEWQMMFADAWRMHRDYFYDPNMHGVNWPEMRLKYGSLVGRVSDRRELEDLTAQMISELSALHASVRGGELRDGPDDISVGFLGARTTRHADGFRIAKIYRSDPDRPTLRSPLAQLDMDVQDGDVITKINGRDVTEVRELGELLRDQVGKPVRIDLQRGDKAFAIVTKPISLRSERGLRYHGWEYSRRMQVESKGKGRLGYVHLRAMGRGDMEQWAREFYPIFEREGLVIDVRHNSGGNIDSWILARLLRKTWFHWTLRTGRPMGNMPYAFNGHIVLLCNAHTASDGEAFAEGFKRLDLGEIIGTRTWGGEIWLSRSNRMVDGGVASAGMMGVFGPEGKWLIENHGVDPDIEVDNLPHETFLGRDRQLEAAIAHLQRLIETEPVVIAPEPPAFPDKSFGRNQR